MHQLLLRMPVKAIKLPKTLPVRLKAMLPRQKTILKLLLMRKVLPTVWLISTVITHRFLLLPVLLHQQMPLPVPQPVLLKARQLQHHQRLHKLRLQLRQRIAKRKLLVLLVRWLQVLPPLLRMLAMFPLPKAMNRQPALQPR